jgi:RNA polymerase subunit RPABC4/transcription elongation factor Spt4
MSRITKRPQNMCYNCWYTWYPRGKYISNTCPNCGSRSTGLDISGFLLLVILVIVVLMILH